MAGLWIVWTKGLSAKREVAVLASKLKRDRCEIAGRLMLLWEWADDNFTDEDVDPDTANVSLVLGDKCPEFLDTIMGLPGMSKAMASAEVGWLTFSKGGRATFPHLARHNGSSAKTRAYEQKKKQVQRSKRGGCVPEMSPISGDKIGTTEQKRIEEIHTPGERSPEAAQQEDERQYPARRDASKDLILPPIALDRLKNYTPDVQGKAWAAAHRYREFCPGPKGTALVSDFAVAFADLILEGGEEWLVTYFTPAGAEQLQSEVKAGKRLAPSASPWDVAKFYRDLHKKPSTNGRPHVTPSNPTTPDPAVERIQREKAEAEKNAAKPGSYRKSRRATEGGSDALE